ncbi:MAG: tRNA-(ms[2]io[6]A)-hydroxylase [Myxococcales bacterium]|nr:tRNA-(ms[2]io[6]A)-hydroxylase [Myxococcales bacterium]
MIRLRVSTPPRWLDAVLEDFDAFLLDHAAAERKASAVALSLISHYPDRERLVAAMMDLAREELEHFYQVYRQLIARGLTLAKDRKDAYVRELRGQIRSGSDDYFLDRLLVAGIVEARGCERFGLIADALSDPALAKFYRGITDSEARHKDVFIDLAQTYFPAVRIDPRLDALLDAEASIVDRLEIRAALH